jgi:hypothetical protein
MKNENINLFVKKRVRSGCRGGYSGGNTAEGQNALLSLITGSIIVKKSLAKLAGLLAKFMKTEVWIRERALLPTAFSLVQACSRTNNQSGERKGLFYENENFTHDKSD